MKLHWAVTLALSLAFSGAWAGEPLKADLDLDGEVDFADFLGFAMVFGRTTGPVSILPGANRINVLTGEAWTLESREWEQGGVVNASSDSLQGVMHASVVSTNVCFLTWQIRNFTTGTGEMDWWKCNTTTGLDLCADTSGTMDVTSQYSGETQVVRFGIVRDTISAVTVRESLQISRLIDGVTWTETWARTVTSYVPGGNGPIDIVKPN